MRKVLLTAAVTAALALAPGLVPEARAGHDWLAIGTGFRIGHAHVAVVLGRPALGVGFHQPAYYYRYDRPIRYRGHRCSQYCFRDAGSYYHHGSCSLVGAHFRAYRVDPRFVLARYAPRFDHRYDRHRNHDRGRDRLDRHERQDPRDRFDRGDRRHRGDRDDRWERRHDRRGRYDDWRDGGRHRGRGRGHRHHPGCGH
jgi:hypothetical protein